MEIWSGSDGLTMVFQVLRWNSTSGIGAGVTLWQDRKSSRHGKIHFFKSWKRMSPEFFRVPQCHALPQWTIVVNSPLVKPYSHDDAGSFCSGFLTLSFRLVDAILSTSTSVFLSKEVLNGLEIQGMPAQALRLLRYGFPLWSQVKHLNKHRELLWSQTLGQIPFFPPCKATAAWVLSPFSLFLRAHTHVEFRFYNILCFATYIYIYTYIRYIHIYIYTYFLWLHVY